MKRTLTISTLAALAVFAMSPLPVEAAARPAPVLGGSLGGAVAVGAACVGFCSSGEHHAKPTTGTTSGAPSGTTSGTTSGAVTTSGADPSVTRREAFASAIGRARTFVASHLQLRPKSQIP